MIKCGLSFKELKSARAAMVQLVLGFWWDSVRRTRTLEDAKLQSYLENFRAMATGEKGGKWTFKGMRFYRIIDMFIECCLGKSDKQSTDTHFRSEDGEASFNWRMKFDVTLQTWRLSGFPPGGLGRQRMRRRGQCPG